MYVAVELARSNAYYAAWALSTDAAELPVAAAAARVAASEAFFHAAKENIQTHGGMGFTWEFDCHMYYRRAKLLALTLGSTRALEGQAHHAPRSASLKERRMDFNDSPQEAAFRREARAWLEANAERRAYPGETWKARHGETEGLARAKAWQAKKHAAGLAAITWAPEYGGRGGTPSSR